MKKNYKCGHGICDTCFRGWVETKGLNDSTCPLCRGEQSCKIVEGLPVEGPLSNFCLHCDLKGPRGSHTDTCPVKIEQGESPIIDPSELSVDFLEPEPEESD